MVRMEEGDVLPSSTEENIDEKIDIVNDEEGMLLI